MFWWHKAAEKVRKGEAERFGFITTNSLRQTFNRRVLEKQMGGKPPLSLAFAIPDHPWVDAELGAAVRISMTAGQAGQKEGRLLIVTTEEKTDELGRNVILDEREGNILADLTIGADVAGTSSLESNKDLAFRGVTLAGAGFLLDQENLENLGEENAGEVIRPFIGGRDLSQRSRNLQVIDFFGLNEDQARGLFPEVYQWVLERVRPGRKAKAGRTKDSDDYAKNWWLFAKTRPEFRSAIDQLEQFIATPRTASRH